MNTQTFGLLELILWWKTEDIWGQILRLSHDTRYYEYGYQCCIWDPGIILSEQSNYPIKIGPGPHLIVSGDQVSPGIGGSQTLYITITSITTIQTQQQQRVRLFEFQSLKILHCVCKSDHIFKSWIRIMYHCLAANQESIWDLFVISLVFTNNRPDKTQISSDNLFEIEAADFKPSLKLISTCFSVTRAAF